MPDTENCYSMTNYYSNIEKGNDKPIITDMIAYARRKRVDLYVIISIANVLWMKRKPEEHSNYTLIYNEVEYQSVFQPETTSPYIIVLKYLIPLSYPNYKESVPFVGVFNVSLRNNVQQRFYKDINVCLRPTPPITRSSTVCALISNAVSPYQISHWLSYYFLVGIDKAYLYSVLPESSYHEILSKLKDPSMVEFVDWNFNNRKNGSEISTGRVHKEAEAMSCFYRNKYASRFVLLADLDQYFYVNKARQMKSIVPYLRRWEHEYPKVDVFNVRWNYFSTKEPITHTIDKNGLYKNATFFEFFKEVESDGGSTVIRPILTQHFDGILDPLSCNLCTLAVPQNDTIRMANYKNRKTSQATVQDTILRLYSRSLQKKQSELFGCCLCCNKHKIEKTGRHARAPSVAAR